jgi:cyclophilin family peptidyl-prolyl cis-trans isomerase/HEAT repeat protein
MTKSLATLAGVVLLAQVIGRPGSQQAPRPPTQQQFAQTEQQASGVPYQVLFAEKEWAGADVLVPLLSSDQTAVRAAAILAVGRLEDPRTIGALLAAPAATTPYAVAQALHALDPREDAGPVNQVANWLSGVPAGMVRYASLEQMRGVERANRLLAEMTKNDHSRAADYSAAIATLERLARVNQRLGRFEDTTVDTLAHCVAGQSLNDDDAGIRRHAFTALMNAGAVDIESEKHALKELDWANRRLAVGVLAGTGGGFDGDARAAAIQSALADESPLVRYDALQAYLRRAVTAGGCGPILDRLNDDDTHVSLAAIDALRDHCPDDQDITTRVAAEATTPPMQNWHRPAHAFLALSKRAPDRAEAAMEAFVAHPNWWVRLYAAKAAAALEDGVWLEKLAADSNDNVREATLVPLRKLKKFDADDTIASTLNSGDVQLLRTAALLLKESPHSHSLVRPLMAALTRLTKEGKETSRDARLALLDALEVHAQQADAQELTPLIKDFDPKVATRAAALMTKLAGKEVVAEPVLPHRGWPAEFNHAKDRCVTVDMASAGRFILDMDWNAPITVDHFLKLATKDHYYDGLTFHRVEPNFVIQGGSPGANEYSGAKDYMRDEISPLASHVRGTVGLSTRGRNTADAQFFVNLVDNGRLDLSYTIFASVRETDMAVIDRIEEGAEIRSIMLGCSAKK